MAWLLDTNILSEIRKARPEPKVLAFVAGTPLDELYVSTVTLAELRFGIDLLSHGTTHGLTSSNGSRIQFGQCSPTACCL